ncbi:MULTISPECIES: DMT family transporter [unclassified Streptomyces]|uniref:DMT family transporter n=1 Tax=unclassified Streptomyces TaxID=2593676 RepID=UPI00081E5FC0|nr:MULTISPECIES: DMT family transporter [unclassified Streptomyces]MYR92559.1 EamA family transporter [Streptomyces sp. SID4937]SCD36211.1 Permease of the drug/metabolite transporter (DMT) superfamily [Streptomyces sp. ScaeMP-e83]
MNIANWGRFGLLAALWGCSFAFIKMSLEAFAPLQLASGRLVVGALVVLAMLAVKRLPLPSRPLWGHIAVASVFGNVIPFTLFAIGEQHTTATIAGVIQGATPLITMGVAALALSEEKPTRRKVAGLAGGFVGLIIVVGPWNTDGFGSIGGQLACVGAAASYAVSFVYIRRFIGPHKLPALSVTAAQLSAASVITVVLTTFVTGWSLHGDLTAKPLLALLVLGAASTGIAFALLNRLIADAGPTTASGVNYLVPVFSVVVGVLALSEPLTWNVPVGGVIVIAALALAEGRISALSQSGKPKPTSPVAPDRVPQKSRP